MVRTPQADSNSTTSRRGAVLLIAMALAAAHVAEAQTFERGPARSPHGRLSIPCGSCHTSTSWSPLRNIPEFNHNQETRYPLRGLHEGVECRLCHTKLVFANAGSKCADCHADIHRRQFGARCDECHTVLGWRIQTQAIGRHQNRFPLLGAHAALDCESCHRGGASARFTGLSAECSSCHLKDYETARPLNHREAALPLNCELCHGLDTWRARTFDHARFTSFPLEGAHARVECQSCHVGGRFAGTAPDCFACHARDFSSTRNPDHVKAAFPTDCSGCHSAASWKGARFDHDALTRFALTGAHLRADCASCHPAARYAGTPSDCYSCHIDGFQAARNPDHTKGNFSTDCTRCHTTESWLGVSFDHSLSRFALTGAHTQVACSQCHVNRRFTGTPTDCSGCHLDDFSRTKNPSHSAAGFPQNCSQCHTTAQWQGASFDHATTRFPLTGSHVRVGCNQCHVNDVFAGTTSRCEGCHLSDFNRTSSPNHAAAGFPQNCALCHTTAQWQGASFDHGTTKFALTGAHVQAACGQCHVNNVFAGTPDRCEGCHLGDYNRTSNPNHASAGFPQTCVACHTTARWQGASFDHAATRFALTGAHVQVACGQCHVNNVFAGTPSQCEGCHLEDYSKAANPNHISAGFPRDCAVCHTTVQWQGARFDHNSATRFALTGSHVAIACGQCHVNNVFAGTPSQCDGCHAADYNRTSNPNHAAAGFPRDCKVCHTTVQWTGARFDHATATKFPLTGAHVRASCSQCHANNVFAGTPSQCDGCHLDDYNRTSNPNHASAGFPRDCKVCHTTVQWTGAWFDHNTATRFPLTGAHVQAACGQCHVNNIFAGTPSQCDGCHLDDYNRTSNPNHAAAGFPQNCAVCHTTSKWSGARFDHSAATTFPLTGAHTSVSCSQCHAGNRFDGTPTDCQGCHLDDYNRTTDPNHAAAGFPRDCKACHTTVQWSGARFDHGSATKFPLTGAHSSVSCSQCHAGGRFDGTPTACEGCHLADYNKTTDPNHAAAGFPLDCSVCHSTAGWSGAKFDHSRTDFPLTGKHTSASCTSCHKSGQYDGLSTACVSCHLEEYNATGDPNHVSAGFPQQCQVCHSTSGWKPASFDHNTTGFQLTGKHTSVACASCHIGGRYSGTPTDCYSCHKAAYDSTTNPNHRAAGFPQDCTACHNTTSWDGARFSHKFPIYSGSHAGKWSSCNDCHTNPSNYGVFSCINCHEHEKTQTDKDHDEVKDYVYNSANCYACHPQGKH